MHAILFGLLLVLPRATFASSCAAPLTRADLHFGKLSRTTGIPALANPIWEPYLLSHGSPPFVFVVGPASARKLRALRELSERVALVQIYDLPTHSPAAILAGKHEWYHAAWVGEAQLHVLDVGLARDFEMVRWRNVHAAFDELARLGFTDDEIIRNNGVYLITP